MAFQRAQELEFQKMLVRYCADELQGDAHALAGRALEVAQRHGIMTLGGQALVAEILSVWGLDSAGPESGVGWVQAILAQKGSNSEEILQALRIQFSIETGNETGGEIEGCFEQ